MRIIAGEFRGRRLLPPKGDTTRPITDRVKQSLFDILTPLLPDANIYDCFAGTGSMGLECLSRGAVHATFFEADRSAATCLQQNIATLKVGERSNVIREDIFTWFASKAAAPGENGKSDLIFLDPPYRFLRERPDALQQLAKQMAMHHLSPAGTMIFRHDANDSLSLASLEVYDLRTYGSMTLELLRLREK